MTEADMAGDDRTVIGSRRWSAELDDRDRTHLTALLAWQGDDPFLRLVAERSLALMRLRPGQRVLDVGCGTGVLLPALAAATGPDGGVVGLDYAPGLLGEAQQRIDALALGHAVTVRQGDAHALPFPDNAFDAVHTERVLMHLDDPDAALREMARVVRPGGCVVVAEPDSAGVRVDHPADPEAMALVAARDLAEIRNPGIGLELHRRLARAGLIHRVMEPYTQFDATYHPVSAEVDRQAAAALVAEGRLSRERAEAAIAYLEAASARGEYGWLGTMVVAAGHVPA